MTLADRLKKARESLGYTQKDIATAINTNPQTWQVYESGKSVPGGKVLEGLARLGINVNWLLTGAGSIKLQEEEVKRLLCEEAHDKLRKRIVDRIIRSRPLIVDIYSDIPGLDYEDVVAYADGEKQLTKDQLAEVCRRSGSPYFDDEFIELVTSVDFTVSDKAKKTHFEPIDEELLKMAIEVVEDIKYGDGPGLPSTKAALISLVYVMNSGTKYTKERLERFLGAVCTLINQGVDIEKLSERKLSNLIIEIAQHVVNGGEQEK